MFGRYKLIVYRKDSSTDERAFLPSMTREDAIKKARSIIDENPELALVEIWAEWNAGNEPRLMRIYSEGQWQ